MRALPHLFENNRRWAAARVAAPPDFFASLVAQQTPQYLWIGCSDSRVPANEIVGLPPGELFVHRNIANVVAHADLNCLAVLQFAVDVLKVNRLTGRFPYKVGLHQSCHGLRELRLGSSSERVGPKFNKAKQLLEGLEGIEFVAGKALHAVDALLRWPLQQIFRLLEAKIDCPQDAFAVTDAASLFAGTKLLHLSSLHELSPNEGLVDTTEVVLGATAQLEIIDGEADDPTSVTGSGQVRTYENPPPAPKEHPPFHGYPGFIAGSTMANALGGTGSSPRSDLAAPTRYACRTAASTGIPAAVTAKPYRRLRSSAQPSRNRCSA